VQVCTISILFLQSTSQVFTNLCTWLQLKTEFADEYSFVKIYLNAVVINILSWLASIIPWAIGIHFVDIGQWDNSNADFILWTDTSGKKRLSFVYAGNGFFYLLNPHPIMSKVERKIDIFFLEMVTILSAIHHAINFTSPPQRILLFTNSLDSVGVFDSLSAAEDMHNSVLMAVAGLVLQSSIDLCVRHIEGKKNMHADLLSHLLLDEYHHKFPHDCVRHFLPPKELLPTQWTQSF